MAKTLKRKKVSKNTKRKTIPMKTKKLKKTGGSNNIIENWFRLQLQKKTIGAPCFFCGNKDKEKKGWFGLPERWAWNTQSKSTNILTNYGATSN